MRWAEKTGFTLPLPRLRVPAASSHFQHLSEPAVNSFNLLKWQWKKNNNPASFLLLFPNSISFCYFSELNWLAKCFSRQRESGMKAAFPFWWQRAAWSAPMAVKSQHWPPLFNATAAILGAGVLEQSPSPRTAVGTWGHVQWVHWVSCLGGEKFTSSKGVVIKTMKICMMSSALISLINPFSFFITSFIKWRLENDLKGFKN